MYPAQTPPQPTVQPKAPTVQPNLEVIAKKPTFQVSLPYREELTWPPYCIQCGSYLHLRDYLVTGSFKSGEYGIAEKTTTKVFPGAKICKSCATKQSRFWLITLGIGTGIAITCMVLWYLLWGSIGYAIAMCITPMFATFGVGFILYHIVAEKPPIEVEVQTESKFIGNIRATMYDFVFRNKKYAFEFAKSNSMMSYHTCGQCGLQMLTDASKNYEYCLNCNTVMD